MPFTDHLELPPELARWCWSMSQMKSGPRKHPEGWYQVIFHRRRGLAAGGDILDADEPSMRVRVRRLTWEEALIEAFREMHRITTTPTPSDDYEERVTEFSRRYTPVIWTTGSPPGDPPRSETPTMEHP